MSAFAVDTKASDLDSTAISQIFAALLTARGKHLPSQTWLRKWKTDYWTRLLFSRMSQLSLGNNMLHTWLEGFFLSDGLANQSLALENEKPQKTNDGCLTSLQMEFPLCAQDSSSQRMLKDSCQLKCPTDHWYSPIASIDWKAYITKLRQAYSARLNAERLTSGSECLSWPTAKARDWKDTMGCSLDAVNPDGTHRNRRDRLVGAIAAEMSGPAAADNHSTHGSRQESWATPRCSMAQDKQEDSGKHRLGEQAQNGTTGKLNPRWVETLMGLPVGWTMPNCASPVTIELTNCASLATESFRLQQH